jgi:tryptophan synthase alpha chain
MSARLSQTFDRLRKDRQTAFIPFIMGGDPTPEITAKLLKELPEAGADVIELGMPFSDPMADGPVIEAAGHRALKAGMSLRKILKLVENFRRTNTHTAVILMGYYNPLYHYGVEAFAADAQKAGVDGMIIVDVPPEEEQEVAPLFHDKSIDFIRLIAPTTPPDRQEIITRYSSGFLYYIAVKGITGSQSASLQELQAAIRQLREKCPLPVAAGFGIKTADQAAAIAPLADAVVVGSAIVDVLGKNGPDAAIKFVKELAQAVHNIVDKPDKPL